MLLMGLRSANHRLGKIVLIADSCLVGMAAVLIALKNRGSGAILAAYGSALIPNFILKRRFPPTS
jgi:hypothetical protein